MQRQNGICLPVKVSERIRVCCERNRPDGRCFNRRSLDPTRVRAARRKWRAVLRRYTDWKYMLPKELKIRVEPWEFSHPEGIFNYALGVFVFRGLERMVLSNVHDQI